jgi:hypothetical protein
LAHAAWQGGYADHIPTVLFLFQNHGVSHGHCPSG